MAMSVTSWRNWRRAESRLIENLTSCLDTLCVTSWFGRISFTHVQRIVSLNTACPHDGHWWILEVLNIDEPKVGHVLGGLSGLLTEFQAFLHGIFANAISFELTLIRSMIWFFAFADHQGRLWRGIQLSSPTDQLAPSLKLENPLWPMFVFSRERNKLELSPRVDHRHGHTVSAHQDQQQWCSATGNDCGLGMNLNASNKTTRCVRSDFTLTQRGLPMDTRWTKCNAHESARSTKQNKSSRVIIRREHRMVGPKIHTNLVQNRWSQRRQNNLHNVHVCHGPVMTLPCNFVSLTVFSHATQCICLCMSSVNKMLSHPRKLMFSVFLVTMQSTHSVSSVKINEAMKKKR